VVEDVGPVVNETGVAQVGATSVCQPNPAALAPSKYFMQNSSQIYDKTT
jgi:hypothetical protein